MDFLQTVNVILAIVCIVIGLLLMLLGGWFLWSGLKNRERPSVVIAILIFILAVFAFVGAFNLFKYGIIRAAPYMSQHLISVA